MPQLPNFEQLGQVQPQTQEAPQLSDAVATQTDAAGEKLGESMVNLGRRMDLADYYQGNIQMQYAKSDLAQKQAAFLSAAQTDPDYATLPQRYNDYMTKAIGDASANIENPAHQQLFNAYANKTAYATGEMQVDAIAHKGFVSDAQSKLDQQTQQQINVALTNPAMTTQALQTIQGLTDATVKVGAMDQAHGTVYAQQQVQKLATARLETMPGAQQVATLQPMIDQMQGKPPAQVSGAANNPAMPTTAPDAINFVMQKMEGSGIVANDNGQGPSKFGIVGADNGLTPQQVVGLTPDKAAQIYKTNYWDAIGADNLPANMRLAAFDTAVNLGVPQAKQLIQQADGDPNKLIAERGAFYANLVQQNPAKYSSSAQGWAARQTLLGQAINGTGPQPTNGDWTDFLPKEQLPELYQRAQATAARDQRQSDDANQAQIDKTNLDLFNKHAQDNLTVQDVQQAAPIIGADKAEQWLGKVATGPDKVDPNDPNVIKTRGIMTNMQAEQPDQFMNYDFTKLAGQLPAPEIAKMQENAANLRKGDAGITADNKQAKDVTDAVQDMLPYAWQRPTASNNDVANAAAFKGNLISAVKDAETTGGKPLSRDDVRGMASDMLGNVSIHRDDWFDKTVPAYQVPAGTPPQNVYRGSPSNIYVPDSFRVGFGREWQNKMGAAPAESDVRLAYLKSLPQQSQPQQ